VRICAPWIRSAGFDSLLVIAPAWLVGCAVLLLPNTFRAGSVVSPLLWLVLVVGFDVAHVYSTLYRTYLDKRERRAHGALLYVTPLACWLAAMILYSIGPALFWTVLAYVAVFHFVRQQYGLMMLYGTPEERQCIRTRLCDTAMVGAATLYPLIYWHTHLPRSAAWFIEGDFVPLPALIDPLAAGVYAIVAFCYLGNIVRRVTGGAAVNIPRHALIVGTALSWYVGIVGVDSDLAFTFSNVLAHAIPYFALIWVYGENRDALEKNRAPLFTLRWLPALILLLVALAFIEEGLWDGFIWREHLQFFGSFARLPILSQQVQVFVVPLLVLPQLTHYVLDGFIWRLRHEPEWRHTLLLKRQMVIA